MIAINVKADVAEAVAGLRRAQRDQVPFATSFALNTTARQVKAALEDDIRGRFDRPTTFTQRAIYIKPSTKARLEAKVWLKDDFGTTQHYLEPHVYGSARRLKAFEKKLQHFGIMPRDMFAVPGAACPLDAYGNIPRGFINQVLSYLGASELVAGSKSNTTERTRKSIEGRLAKRVFGFAGLRGQLVVHRGAQDTSRRVRVGANGTNVSFQGRLPQPGIWLRAVFGSGGDSIRPIIIFVKQPVYRKRWDFFATAERVIEKNFKRNFDVALARALASAR